MFHETLGPIDCGVPYSMPLAFVYRVYPIAAALRPRVPRQDYTYMPEDDMVTQQRGCQSNTAAGAR